MIKDYYTLIIGIIWLVMLFIAYYIGLTKNQFKHIDEMSNLELKIMLQQELIKGKCKQDLVNERRRNEKR